tara:strand:- start:1960 stop:3666 length:1707 start_codon:yes stop_codon:yes gene_type:complete
MAGTATLIANKQFDINTTTLNQFADLYVAEANLKDPQVWAAEFRRNPLFKDSLKMTVGEYMDTISKGTNPYVVLYDEVSDRFIDEGFKGKELADKISNALTDIRSKLQVLEDNHNNNVIVKRLDKEQVFAVKEAPKLVKTTGKKGVEWIDPSKMGELQYKLLQHAKKNPEDSDRVRLAFLGLYTGFRPNELGVLNIGDITNLESSMLPGISLDQSRVKNKNLMNVALSPSAYAIIQQQMEALQAAGIEITKDTKLFENIPEVMKYENNTHKPDADKAINKILSKIKVPNISGFYDKSKPNKDTITSYAFRRSYGTVTGKGYLNFSYDQSGSAIGRPAAEGAMQAAYDNPPPGQFATLKAGQVQMSVADFYQRSFQKFAGIDIPPNFKIDPNTDFIRVALEGKKIKYVPEKDFDTVTEYVDPQTVKQAPEKKKAAGAGIKKKIIQTWDDMPPHLKNIFKGGGKVMSFAAQKLASPAAGTLVGMAAYEEAIAQGTSQPRAIAKAAAIGATEFLPVSFTDVKDTVGFIDKNREFYEEQRGTVNREALLKLPKNQPEYGTGEFTTYDNFLTK